MKNLLIIFTSILVMATFQVNAQVHEQMRAVIDSAGTNSDTLDIGYKQLLSITFPSTFTGATVSIYHSNYLDSAFVPLALSDGSGVFTVTALDGYTVPVEPLKTYFIRRYIYIKSASAEAGQRILTVDKGVF